MLVTSLLTAAALAVHGLGVAWTGGRGTHWAGWAMLPFLGYAAHNVQVITPVRWLGWHDWFFWAHLLAWFWLALNGVRSRWAWSVLLAVVVALLVAATALAGYQRFVRPDWLMLGREQADQFIGRASGPFGIPNSLAAFYLLFLPVLAVLTVRHGAPAWQRVLFGYTTVCAAVGLFLTVSRGGWLGLVLAVCAWPLFAGSWAWWRRLLAVGAVAFAAVMVLGGLYQLSPRVQGRIQDSQRESGEWTRPIMWRGAWELFKSRPWFGTGAGSYNVLFEKHRPERYQMEPQWAHNDYLNTASDYGVVGFGLSFGVAGGLALAAILRRRTGRAPSRGRLLAWDDPGLGPAVGIGLFAFALQLFVDFHFKIPALGMLFALAAGFLVRRVWPRGDWRLPLARVTAALVAGVVIAGAAGGIWPHYRAETLRYVNRQALDKLWQFEPSEPRYRETLVKAQADLAAACELDPTNAQAWADRALAAALWTHVEPAEMAELGRLAEGWADRAVALAPVAFEAWIRRSVARDLRGD